MSIENNTKIQTVPKIIYQTWHSKRIPVGMYKSIINLKKHNPEFKYCLYNDTDCRDFIIKWFDNTVVNAFDTLIPGAYKADLWRYCILYKLGGVYIDIKYTSVKGNKLINLIGKEHFVMDCDKSGIYNAFMICKPGNKLLLDCIYQIVLNVQTNYYGNSSLDPTGPKLLYQKMKNRGNCNDDVDMIHHYNNKGDKFITFLNNPILKTYTGFLSDREKFTRVIHYSTLWNTKHIYNK
jgi:mannosyltransferase OCH1-like enzyme